MEKIPSDQKHGSQTFIYCGAKALERGSFYGVRSLLVLYMLNSPLGFDTNSGNEIYGWFVGSIALAVLLGALVGDFVIGNKRAAIVGGILQMLGCLMLCLPSREWFYAGLAAISLGTGLFSPNLISNFGKTYLTKMRLADGGFSLFYLTINFGAFLGIAIITLTGYADYFSGFIIGGVMMLISTVLTAFTKQPEVNTEVSDSFSASIKIAFSIVILGIFWTLYSYAGDGMYLLEGELESKTGLPFPITTFYSSFAIIVGLAATLFWSFFYLQTIWKWTLGFAIAAVSFAIMYAMTGSSFATIPAYAVAALMLSVAEMLIAPSLYSVLLRNTNPKYFATMVALAGIPATLAGYLSFTSGILSGGGYNSLLITSIVLIVIAAMLFVMRLTKKTA